MHIIAGTYKKRNLAWPDGRGSRPTPGIVREALFSMLMEVIPNSRVLELAAGGGAIGLEALSRGADQVTFLEADTRALSALRANIHKLDCEDRCQVYSDTFTEFLARHTYNERQYDIVYVNPIYDAKKGRRQVSMLQRWEGLARGACLALLGDAHCDPPEGEGGWELLADRKYGKQRLTLWQQSFDDAPETANARTEETGAPSRSEQLEQLER